MDEASGFSIGELSRRTGVPVATLRSWEDRYGQPRAQRLPGGHRRYDDASVEAVLLMRRHRDSGLSMAASAAAVAASPDATGDSVFAGLRAAHPELPVHVLSKGSLLALTRAAEDEFVARAGRAVLFAAFQRTRFFRQSRLRWTELARTADFAAVFADFDGSELDGRLHLTAVPPDSPLMREWLLVCDSPGYAVCLVGWEQPGTPADADGRRRFETVWTVDPRAVRTAAELAARHLADPTADPTAADAALERAFSRTPAPPSPDLERATSLFQRLVGYLDAASPR